MKPDQPTPEQIEAWFGGQRGLRNIVRLLASDYRAGYAFKGESERRRRLLLLPRLLTNASLHANLLIRLMVGTPKPWAYVWRRLLLSSHSIDVARDISIGPGLELPHPFGIVIGANTRIGANVCLHHGASAGPLPETGDRWYPGETTWVTIGDGAVLFPYVHVQANVGEGSQVLNHALVFRPIPPHCVAAGAPARIVRKLEDTGEGQSPPDHGGKPDPTDDRSTPLADLHVSGQPPLSR